MLVKVPFPDRALAEDRSARHCSIGPSPEPSSGTDEGAARAATAQRSRLPPSRKLALGEGYGEPPRYPIDSVDNALKVILMFTHRKSIRLTDVSAALGVAHSTAHRLTAMLVYRGFIARERDSKLFVAGPALLDVGLAVVRSLDLRAVARPVMERLAHEIGETVHLAVREGSDVRRLLTCRPTAGVGPQPRVGSTEPR